MTPTREPPAVLSEAVLDAMPIGVAIVDADMRMQIPDMDSMASKWRSYVAGQDLTGYDRDRVAELGSSYLSRAVEETAS